MAPAKPPVVVIVPAAVTAPVAVIRTLPPSKLVPPVVVIAPNDKAFASTMWRFREELTDTAPPKSFPALLSVTLLVVPAARVVVPLTFKAVAVIWLITPAPVMAKVPGPVPTVVVSMLPSILAPVPVMLTFPPFVTREPAAPKVVAAVALRFTLSASALLDTALLTKILPAAVRVRVAAAPDDLVMASTIVMSPA